MKRCENCGAPLTGDVCEYCGAERKPFIFEGKALHAVLDSEVGTLEFGKETVKVFLTKITFTGSDEIEISRLEDGRIHRGIAKAKRIFVLEEV